MAGRKSHWIRKQLGLSDVELTRQLGISRRSLRMVSALHGVLEEPSEQEDDAKTKGQAGKSWRQKKS